MTHESTVAKALKPGGFEDFAHFAYAATAWK
jgi:hypothetical protein